jgi:hypothetical protein
VIFFQNKKTIKAIILKIKIEKIQITLAEFEIVLSLIITKIPINAINKIEISVIARILMNVGIIIYIFMYIKINFERTNQELYSLAHYICS